MHQVYISASPLPPAAYHRRRDELLLLGGAPHMFAALLASYWQASAPAAPYERHGLPPVRQHGCPDPPHGMHTPPTHACPLPLPLPSPQSASAPHTPYSCWPTRWSPPPPPPLPPSATLNSVARACAGMRRTAGEQTPLSATTRRPPSQRRPGVWSRGGEAGSHAVQRLKQLQTQPAPLLKTHSINR